MTNYELGLPEKAKLNPMQEVALPFVGTTNNIIMAAPTAAGKSTLFRMFGNVQLSLGKVIVYVAPMKALVEEKKRSWSKPGQSWENKNIAVITGDYSRNNSRQEEIDNADIIITTPESLASALRHLNSPKNQWVHKIGLLGVDEIHLLGEEGRGSNLEAALMDFTKDFPEVQILGLSATMPNYAEIGNWLSLVTGRQTEILYSDYRPNELEHHFLTYTPGQSKLTEALRIQMILNLVQSRPDDTFLVCVYKKSFGQAIYRELDKAHISADFHYGNLSKQARERIETLFDKGRIRVLVATKTMTVGVDSKADCAIITDMMAGGREIPASEIQQGAGRAGRHKAGHVFYLMANDANLKRHMERVRTGETVLSQMSSTRSIATHFLGAIYRERILRIDGFYEWYSRSFNVYQQNITPYKIEHMGAHIAEDMRKLGMVWVSEDGEVSLTNRGRIAAQLLMDPYYVADLCRNFRKYFGLTNPNDTDLACALGECSPHYAQFITVSELATIPMQIRKSSKENFWKSCSVYWYRLTGTDVPEALRQLNNDLYNDLSRVKECVRRLGAESEKWPDLDRIDRMFVRVARGVTWEQAGMILDKFTKREQTDLHRLGIYSVEDAKKNAAMVKSVLSPKRMSELGIVEEFYGS